MTRGLPDCDVVVVGASGAGLFAAEHLARAGWSVVVLERRGRIGELKRTWIVTSHVEKLLGRLPSGVAVHKTDEMELWAGDAVARVRLDPPDLIIQRSAFLRYLADRAQSAGAEVRFGLDVQNIGSSAGAIRVGGTRRAGGEPFSLTARHLVAADGAHTTVARRVGATVQDAYPVVQAVVELPGGSEPNVTRVWFDRQRTRFFYWLIPHSEREGVVGLVAESPRSARADLDGFLADRGYRPLEYEGAMIPMHRPFRRMERRVGGGRVLLVGDAAAHVKVTTVGGVVTGLWGARAAARALLRHTSFRRELRGLHRELWLHDVMRWSMDRFSQQEYVRLIEMMNPALRKVLGRRNRDTMAGAWWKLVLAQPGILGLGLRSLISPYRDLGRTAQETGGGAGAVDVRVAN